MADVKEVVKEVVKKVGLRHANELDTFLEENMGEPLDKVMAGKIFMLANKALVETCCEVKALLIAKQVGA